jgi:glycerol-3-phosphate dehydrogenase (NAD(P)+)
MSRVAIVGAGAWGTAISIVLGRQNRHAVRLWARERDVYQSISNTRRNALFLPDYAIPDSVEPATDLVNAVAQAEIIVSAVPSQHCRAIFEQLAAYLRPGILVVSATKGLEQATLLRMTEVITAVIGNSCPVGALSGPTFASEVARGDPTALAIASLSSDLMTTVQSEFSDSSFRIYRNHDVAGLEFGGALKNVIAIAAGVCHGLGLGHNSIAALITRGLAEMTRLVVACGGRAETLAGLAGLGDLVLTCTGELSRNRSLGMELGKGRKLPDIIAGMHGQVAEGVFTTYAAVQLAHARGVEMPITEQMHAILNAGRPPRQAIQELMARDFKSESAFILSESPTK